MKQFIILVVVVCAFIGTGGLAQTVEVNSGGVKVEGAGRSEVGTAKTGTSAITGSDLKKTVAAGAKGITITGSDNTIRITGKCLRLTVTGSDNTVYTDTIKQISVVGSGNKVYWRKGWTAKTKPSVSSTGADNVVTRSPK
ncbi:MAG: DUF3060 domain-containing protein [Armatimonadetes bacterium]|nr:DUF3060 domain-containing protein [Armatimonadota bacterium]